MRSETVRPVLLFSPQKRACSQWHLCLECRTCSLMFLCRSSCSLSVCTWFSTSTLLRISDVSWFFASDRTPSICAKQGWNQSERHGWRLRRVRTYVFQLILEVSEGVAEVPLLRQKFAVFCLFWDKSRLNVPPLEQRIGQIALLLVAPGEQQQFQELVAAQLNTCFRQISAQIPIRKAAFSALSLYSAGFLVDPRVAHRNCRSLGGPAPSLAPRNTHHIYLNLLLVKDLYIAESSRLLVDFPSGGAQHHAPSFNDVGYFSGYATVCIILVDVF